jgi:hypothetical protein
LSDAIAIEHNDKLYRIGLDEIAQYEVADDDAKREVLAARDDGSATIDSDDEVSGFAAGGPPLQGASAWLVRRKPYS